MASGEGGGATRDERGRHGRERGQHGDERGDTVMVVAGEAAPREASALRRAAPTADLSNLHEKSLGRSPMVVTVSARYARVGSFYRYAATHWGRFTATRPLTWGILPLRGHSLGGSLAATRPLTISAGREK